ncbi:MAG TPA: TonB-dependent receptor [Sphingobium sp.]
MNRCKYLIWATALCSPNALFAQTVLPSSSTTPTAPQGEAAVAGATSDIIVTAQKRSERLLEVPLSITASNNEQLRTAGVSSADDLAKVVPGFTFLKGLFGLPVYFIRGIGFNDQSLGVSPAVTVYVDQVPLPYAPMARGATLDLERVEVLKGPQGTLFGQNSTGGAVNYIAAKPTDHFDAGIDVEYGRFNTVNAEAFVSGPLSETLKARFAVRSERGDDWQRGYVSYETLGKKKFLNGRAIIDWTPSSALHVVLMATGWEDKSDVQQPQFVSFRTPDFAPTARPIPFPSDTFPAAPNDNRAAAWDPDYNYSQNSSFYQFALHADLSLSDTTTLSAITAYSHYRTRVPIDVDATIYTIDRVVTSGRISSFSQELRLNGELGHFRWMVGGNYGSDRVVESELVDPVISSSNFIGPFTFTSVDNRTDQKIRTASGFGSLDFDISDRLTLQGSVRYTDQDRRFSGCNYDTGGGDLSNALAFLSSIVTGSPQTIAPGACIVLSPDTFRPVPEGIVNKRLKEDNVAWRASLNFKPQQGLLFYANVTKGYKAGGFPNVYAITSDSLNAIKQESVLAYELGSKADLFDHKVQLTGAAFYYDYRNKQLLGSYNNSVFGVNPQLVSLPKSRVIGAELNINARPISGLTLNVGGTYLNTKVQRDSPLPVGPFGNQGSYIGNRFPFTPKWQALADIQYEFPATGTLNAFVGGNFTVRSNASTALFVGDGIAPRDGVSFSKLDSALVVKGYALVDLRAGVETIDGKMRFELWGRNVFNQFYTTNAQRSGDTVYRFAGNPATYGIRLRYRL